MTGPMPPIVILKGLESLPIPTAADAWAEQQRAIGEIDPHARGSDVVVTRDAATGATIITDRATGKRIR